MYNILLVANTVSVSNFNDCNTQLISIIFSVVLSVVLIIHVYIHFCGVLR